MVAQRILSAKTESILNGAESVWTEERCIRDDHRRQTIERIAFWGSLAVILFCLAGSVFGILRIRELRRQQRALDAAATFYRTIREMHETAFAARHDANNPTRGLAAVADAIAYKVEYGMEAAAGTEVAK